jgi:hypothetical protein
VQNVNALLWLVVEKALRNVLIAPKEFVVIVVLIFIQKRIFALKRMLVVHIDSICQKESKITITIIFIFIFSSIAEFFKYTKAFVCSCSRN